MAARVPVGEMEWCLVMRFFELWNAGKEANHFWLGELHELGLDMNLKIPLTHPPKQAGS